jgi:Tol biopolymer transport system component
MALFILLVLFLANGTGCDKKEQEKNPTAAGEPAPADTTMTSTSAFADTALERVVRVALNKPAGTITQADLLSLKELDGSGSGIVDLRGIEQLSLLATLLLPDNRVEDLSPLASLKVLRSLDLDNNRVHDLLPLAQLSQLEVLILSRNQVQDLTPILGLANLRSVELSGNPLSTEAINSQLSALQRQGAQVTFQPGERPANGEIAGSLPGTTAFGVALVSGVFGEEGDIFLVQTDGSLPSNLTQKPDRYTNLAWSPDGVRLVFVADNGSALGNMIFSMNADGGDRIALAKQADLYGEPAWSPDGGWIAFSNRQHTYKVQADGGDPQLLGNNLDFDYIPTWSPNGAHIAFLRLAQIDGKEYVFDFYMMDADGTGKTKLSEQHTNRLMDYPASWRAESSPWSPAGMLAFSQGKIRGTGADAEIYTAMLEGSALLKLTDHPGADWGPAWSPDGTKIAFVSDRDGNWEIYVMGADGSNPVNLSRDPGQDLLPKWSPDGRHIAYLHALDNNQFDLYLAEVEGEKQINLTNQNPATSGIYNWAPR